MISNKNFSDVPVANIPVDTEYQGCNFSRSAPDTSGADPVGIRLFPGDNTPRTFIRCNLVNCEPPPNSTLTDCNTTIVERDFVFETDTIVVDSVTVATTIQKGSRIYGRWDNVAQSYEYLPVPRDEVDPR